jgi:hypothetical protein
MALTTTLRKLDNGNIEVYLNYNLLFATIRKVAPSRAKGNYKWSFTLEHLPVEAYALYKDAPDAVIAIENYVNLINRATPNA